MQGIALPLSEIFLILRKPVPKFSIFLDVEHVFFNLQQKHGYKLNKCNLLTTKIGHAYSHLDHHSNISAINMYPIYLFFGGYIYPIFI